MLGFHIDGVKVAQKIHDRLLKKGELSFDEILEIYDSHEFPIFRKTEWHIWENLNKMEDVEKFADKNNRVCLRIKEDNK